MLIAIVPLLCAVVGLLLYAFARNAKVERVGLVMFAAAFLVLMFTVAKQTVRIF